MQNIMLPPATPNLPTNSTASAITDNSQTDNQANGTFSEIMRQETANNVAVNQQDSHTAGEIQKPTNLAEHHQLMVVDQNQGAKFIQGINETGINVAANTKTSIPELGSALVIPGLPNANTLSQPNSIEQAQHLDNSLATTTHVLLQAPAQYISPAGNSPENLAGQFSNTANFAASSKFMPPLTEAFSNNNLSMIDEITVPQVSALKDTQLFPPDNSTLLTAAAPSSSALPTDVTTADLGIDIQLGQPKWGDEFAQKIVWLTGQQQQVAEIRLNPAHLGPIEIMLNITNDQDIQANAQFVSAHVAVREAIEAALPKLREMLADNGITLGNVTIDSNSSQQQRDAWRHEHFASSTADDRSGTSRESIEPEKNLNVTSNHSGLVNTFA